MNASSLAEDFAKTTQLSAPRSIFVDVPHHILEIPAAVRKERRETFEKHGTIVFGLHADKRHDDITNDEVVLLNGRPELIEQPYSMRRCLTTDERMMLVIDDEPIFGKLHWKDKMYYAFFAAGVLAFGFMFYTRVL